MKWRVVDNSETDLLKQAAAFERAFPDFYRDSSNTWTATEDEAVEFYQRCEVLFGLFKDERFVGLVYFEGIAPGVTNVHFDVERGVDPSEVVPCIAGIRDHRFADGIALCHAWVLRRNRGVQEMLKAIGFKFSGLRMKAGSSHGKVLEWAQMLIAPSSVAEAVV